MQEGTTSRQKAFCRPPPVNMDIRERIVDGWTYSGSSIYGAGVALISVRQYYFVKPVGFRYPVLHVVSLVVLPRQLPSPPPFLLPP